MAKETKEPGHVVAIVDDLLQSYERGLDTAGAAADASFFDGLRHDLRHGVAPAETLLYVFDRYGHRNGNKEVAAEFLAAVLVPLEEALKALQEIAHSGNDRGLADLDARHAHCIAVAFKALPAAAR